MKLAECEQDNECGQSQDEAKIAGKSEEGDSKKRQIKREQQKAQAEQGDKIGTKPSSILRVITQ